MINVLWIDDQPNEAFIDNAYSNDLRLQFRLNVDDGIKELLSPSISYDAIILDANCISHNDRSNEPDISALSYALRKITENKIDTPWFVYSGGGFSGEESIDVIVRSYERSYDDKNWYKKPREMSDLFKKIKRVVLKVELYNMKNKYPDIFSWYPNQEDLVTILEFIEKHKDRDPSVFNLVRKELDWVMEYCNACGILQIEYEGSNLAECSSFLGNKKLQDFVPLHIQRSFHSATSICNEGSHRLVMDDLVKNGKAPYLVQSTVYEFLNILSWVNGLPKTPEGREDLKTQVEDLLKEPEVGNMADYEGKEFTIEQDERNNFHCGNCRLSYTKALTSIGKRVKLFGVTENKAKSKDNYPYFADFTIIV